MSPVRGLYVITADYPDLGRSHLDVACAALEGGARVVQYRDKVRRGEQLVEMAEAIRDRCLAYGAAFVVNDHVDVAMRVKADGLHLGQDELDRVDEWRPSWGAFLGVTAWTPELAMRARGLGADYVGSGPVRATSSKQVSRDPIGVAGIRAVCGCGLPVAAIGGMDVDNVAGVMAAGASAVCVMAAVGKADDPVRAARAIARAVER